MRLERWLPLLATLVALSAIGSAQEDARESRSVRRLLDPRHRGGRPDAELVQELVGVGARAAPLYVGLLCGTIPPTDWEASGLTRAEAENERAGEAALLSAALLQLPADSVTLALQLQCGGRSELPLRLVGLHLLAEVGRGRGVFPCWLELAGGIEELHLQRAYVRAQLEEALSCGLARSPESFEALAKSTRTLERRLLPAVVNACAQAAQRQGMDVLWNLRGRDRELDLALLERLPELGAASLGALDELQLAWLGSFLADEDPLVRSNALLAFGRVCDPTHAQALCDALADPDGRVVQAALWALKRVSGGQLFVERADWESWLRSEVAWSDAERPLEMQALESPDPARVVEALRELTRHPLYRHESAGAVSRLLVHEDPALLCAACAALEQLGSMAGTQGLDSLLNSADAQVIAAAQRAQRTLTGRASLRD
ncbi:MAG: HEAT repeat domain-containing protein [Planctomycetes bacterium]|nr:HEAT repeat domain-containing protein [Planctomycetota bacterium]